jgi:hypothetical protein
MKTTEVRCPCGAVTIALRGDPVMQFYCHCDDCRAVGGGAYVGLALFSSDNVRTNGETDTWTLRSLARERCKVCGTHVFAAIPAFGQHAIKANLLPPGTFRPAFHIHCRRAVLPVEDDLPHYAALPAAFGGTDEEIDW